MLLKKEKVLFKKLNKEAIVPKYATEYAAGADLYACMGKDINIPAGSTVEVHTGIAISVPEGYVGLIYARSGLATKKGIAPANKVGVIDADYRGEIIVMLHNHSKEDAKIEDFERVAQLVITPVSQAIFEEVVSLDQTVRGTGGFGSTGKK